MILKIVEIPHALNSTHIGYNAQLSFINGVETIEEIPKLEIIAESKLCSKRLLNSDSLQYEKEKMKLYLARFLIW